MAIDYSGNFLYPLTRHPAIVRAVYSSVYSTVTSDTFGSLVPLRSQVDLFNVRALVLDGRLRAEHKQPVGDLTANVIQALFQNPVVFSHTLVAEVLEYVSLSESRIGPEIYRGLLKRCFIDEVERRFAHIPKPDPSEKGETNWFRDDGYAFPRFVSALLDGLEALEQASPDVHVEFVAYLRQPHTVFVLYKILVLADVDACNRLWKLARIGS